METSSWEQYLVPDMSYVTWQPLIAAPDEDTWSGSLSKTSKFAHWFNAEGMVETVAAILLLSCFDHSMSTFIFFVTFGRSS